MVLSILDNFGSAGGADMVDALMAMVLQRLCGKKEAAETMRRVKERGKRGSREGRKRRILEVPSRAEECLSCRLGPKPGPEALGRRSNIFYGGARLAAFCSKSLGKRAAKPWPLGKRIQARSRLYRMLGGTVHVDRVSLGDRRGV